MLNRHLLLSDLKTVGVRKLLLLSPPLLGSRKMESLWFCLMSRYVIVTESIVSLKYCWKNDRLIVRVLLSYSSVQSFDFRINF